MRSAAALIIGNELLSGKIAEANLLVLARELRALGVLLRRAVLVLDDLETIAREVRELSATHDVVFTSGGVGPTHDDLTMEGVARAFGVSVVIADDIAAMIRRYYGERTTEGHLLMARIPEGARLVASPTIPWPTVVMRNVWVLPGVPEVFQMKLPHIRGELGGDAPFFSLAVFTSLDEGDIKPLLDPSSPPTARWRSAATPSGTASSTAPSSPSTAPTRRGCAPPATPSPPGCPPGRSSASSSRAPRNLAAATPNPAAPVATGRIRRENPG